jgi:CMP/dCMP kinase
MPDQVIAIDGPSASGKSTVARKVAALMGYLYVDSGAVYRAVTWKALQKGTVADADALKAMIGQTSIECFARDGAVRFKLDGVELVSELRTERVNENVSVVSAIPDVRTKVVNWLRSMLKFGNLVMEGRDIGTAVFPEAKFKFYLDADPVERARRRSAELAGSGASVQVSAVHDSLKRRDKIDSSRKLDPLKIAPGAVVIDTTSMNADAVAQEIAGRIREKAGSAGSR